MYQSINPATQEYLKKYDTLTDIQLQSKLDNAAKVFQTWKLTSFAERSRLMLNLIDITLAGKEEYAKIISLEMGKPYAEAIAEVEKSTTACKYYAENAEKFLIKKFIPNQHKESYVSYEPLGIVYSIMPWNFPFWQVFRCAVPAIMAGNVVVLKHSENVPGCAENLEKIFMEAGFPEGVFTNLFISHEQSDNVINYNFVRGVSLTGSERAGAAVACIAGKAIKRTVLELGGSDPFIVLEDADIENAAETGVKARMQNCGQSCIAAKRFILHKNIANKFLSVFIEKVEALVVGDPFDKKTNIGPLARPDLLDTLEKQIQKSLTMGAKILSGGTRINSKGNFFRPTVLINIPKNSPAYSEEVFGPCASVFIAENDEDALRIANDTIFGLGASLWTKDKEKAMAFSKRIDSGSVFLNSMVKSDATLPFGGVKHSGYGRELSEAGIHEFVNVKTITWD